MNGKSFSLPFGMAFKKYHCAKCGNKLQKERTHRVVTKDDKDYFRYQSYGKFPRRDYDVYDYRFKCPSCGARISFDEQCIIARIQKKQASFVLTSSEIKSHYQESKEIHHKWVLVRSILFSVIFVLIACAIIFASSAGKTLRSSPSAAIVLLLFMVGTIVGAIRTHKGNYRTRSKFSYSYEKESQLKRLHAYSSHNRSLVTSSNKCYCFHCKGTMDSREITDFADNGQTAKCPKCGIDSIIPDSIDETVDEQIISEMHEYWF